MKDNSDFPAFTASVIEDKIIHINLKKVKELTVSDISQIYEYYRINGNGKPVFALITFNGFIPINNKAIKEAKKQYNQKLLYASAYVTKSVSIRLAATFFFEFFNPKHPMKFFKNKNEAISWLKKLMKTKK